MIISAANTVVDRSSPFQIQLCGVHGRRKDIFQWGTTRGFFQNFSRGVKSGEICFSHSKPRKEPYLVKFSKSRGPCLPFRRPWWS